MMGSAETSRRLACDASRVLMRHDEDGHIVEVGARTRTDTIWRLVTVRGVLKRAA